jgi:hypothetical protein
MLIKDTKGDHAEVVKACTNSKCIHGQSYRYVVVTHGWRLRVFLGLKDDKDYVKALQRRATANEKLDTWSSLTAAQEGT